MYTAATETNRKYWAGREKKCGLLILFVLKTRHAAGITSNKKGNEAGTQIKLRTMSVNVGQVHLQTHPIESDLLPGANCTGSIIKYTISFPFLQS